MNRTTIVASLLVGCLVVSGRAQQPVEPPAAKPQADPIDELVAAMQAGEKKLKSIALELSTSGQWPGGPVMKVQGSLRVVRGAQAAMHSKFEYTTGDGMRGRCESVQTADGIVWFEDDVAFDEVFVQIDAKIVADLEWAGQVLHREDLPGMVAGDPNGATPDRRAACPLGSAIVTASRRQFLLAIDKQRGERNKEPGTWLAGVRRPGLDVQDPDLPIADRVELFVRAKDHALLEMRQFVGDTVLQQMVVEKLELDVEWPAASFVIEKPGLRLRAVQRFQPLWELIEQACLEAEAKNGKGEVRPSKR